MFVDAFVDPRRRSRFRAFVSSKKRRAKFIKELYHLCWLLDERWLQEVVVADVHEALRQRGAPDNCYVMSVHEDLDGRRMKLQEALEEAKEGTVIDCVSGQLAYYRGEDSGEGEWLLRRPANKAIQADAASPRR